LQIPNILLSFNGKHLTLIIKWKQYKQFKWTRKITKSLRRF